MHKIEIINSRELINYESAIEFMKMRINKIHINNEDELIWFLEHDHVYTQGTSAKDDEIIKLSNTNIIKTNRGGKTTYHGPGQRVIYFLINLNKRKKDIRKFISVIEESLITFLASYNIEAKSFKDRVGIWVTKSNNIKFEKEKKIGAIGLRVSKWITYHGLSFNINPDMKYYDNINACGLKNYKNTSLKELNVDINYREFDNKFSQIFLKNLFKI
ncbi:MAG: hypothetical protein CBD97_00005 [Pelagibacteraceae bacterium TMED237]|nr:MAG: hypothetical protein CBD97_00005 [Pelagibacteraceae bacterium TMED237]|tara:strand:+ start:34 stop:681 length:648 start_codon:yes stop_codon:yes gene_type:complete